MPSPTPKEATSVLLCRYGELFLKSGNRKRFQSMLVSNVQASLAGLPGTKVEAPHGRILVHVPVAATEEAAQRVGRVFGLVSLSVAHVVAPELDAIGAAAIAAARVGVERLTRSPGAGVPTPTNRIDARRTDKSFPVPSMELARDIGSRVNVALGLPVDLHAAELHIGVEITSRGAFVYEATRAAPGGLPVGVSGRGLLLLSGGIDSPVAGWLAAKRGLALDAVYFHSPPFIGEKAKDKVLSLARILARWGALKSVTVVGFTEIQKKLRDAGAHDLSVVLYRRMMMRIADVVADGLGAGALVTGENLGQVASQTVENMTAIQAVCRRVVLRPLTTYDKVETTDLARRIGTFETSILPFDDCCSLFVPRHPATKARVADAERIEEALDVGAEVAAAVASAERVMVT
ncbi:MAG: thiamine biosynthesis/tRNA modification protein ThiI [Myxococcales bacterium]|nr:thiamine biosynthesis/tRNA modification protein ThiI [Myxococcales bacterium]